MKEFQNLPNQELPEESNPPAEAADLNEEEKPKVIKFREHEITIPPEKKKEER